MTYRIDQVVADLERLGVAEGDLLMVHASMRRIGPVQDGAAGVVQALERAVGPAGTLVMYLDARAEVAFDYLETPANPENGVLAEVFRTLPGTLVNDHPD